MSAAFSIGDAVQWASSPVTGDCYGATRDRGVVRDGPHKDGLIGVVWSGRFRQLIHPSRLAKATIQPLSGGEGE